MMKNLIRMVIVGTLFVLSPTMVSAKVMAQCGSFKGTAYFYFGGLVSKE